MLLFAAALITTALAGYALRHRKREEAFVFSLMMATLSWWSIFYGLNMMGANFETSYLFNRIKYVGVVAVPPLWFVLALQYTQRQSVLTRRNLLLIFLPALLLLPMVLLDPWLHSWWRGLHSKEFGGLVVLTQEGHTWLYYVHVFVSYVYILAGLWLYIRFRQRQQSIYRSQTNLMLVAALVPLVASILTQLKVFVFPWALDSFFFTLSGVLFAIAIFRYRYLDIMPVARQVIVEQMPDGVIVTDRGGRIVDANPIVRRMIGQAGDLIVGQPLIAHIQHPELRQSLSEVLRQNAMASREFDVCVDTEDRMCTLSVHITPLVREGVGAVGHIFLWRDISERIATQRQLENLYQEAELERKRLALTIATANEPIALLNADGDVLFSNPAAQRILHAEHRAHFPGAIRSAIVSAQGAEDVTRLEVEIDEQSFHVSIAPVARTGGMVLTMYDVTHFKQLSHLKDEFVAIVSHDLRTPLSAILGYTQIAGLEDATEQERQHALERVESNVRQMNALINDLLYLARLEMDVEERRDWVKLDEVVQEVIQMLEEMAVAKDLVIKTDLDDVPPFKAVPRLLVQMWHNLIENAIKYTDEGVVSVELSVEGDQVIGKVSDTGIGIPPADLPYVFDKFYRANFPAVRQTTGTGLGLALSKSIVEKHGGQIWVESELGVGSTFALTLPLEEDK